ncbi:uncharacterized protein LOC105354892 isoform X2 [Oryzias latipes]|nr:uncharacterized protein LOC105354892 isoform X2 [Oryzias latipes]
MYTLQKPDFEVLLLAELQRQQRCKHLCDVLLKAKDASVPVHGCILSALSPSIYSALSSLPPPAGQSWLLEFPTLGASTLLHLVSLFYTGRMTGVAENEKQEAISAAAMLGIHGLVEVIETDDRRRAELCRCKEVEVQTEPRRREEDEGQRGRWRREVVEGNTYLWKETLSGVGKEVWTQTEETNAAPLVLPLASFEAVEVGAFQNVTQPDYPQCVPVAVFCPPKDNQPHQFSCSTPPAGAKEASHSAALVPARTDPPPLTHFSQQMLSETPEPQSSWTGSQGPDRDAVAAEESEDEDFEHFQDNIPGFINYFVNKSKEQDQGHRRRGRGGQRGERAARSGQQRVRRPRGRPRGSRGQRTGTQIVVDVPTVKISRLQKMFLHRWGVKTPRTGQGGGTVGKMLCLKTRDGLTPTRRQRGCSQAWKLSPIKKDQPRIMGGERSSLRQQKSLQENQTQVSRNRSSSVSVPSSSSSTRPMQTSSAHTSLPHAAPHAPGASPILHTTPLPPQEEQPEHIDRLLEEVMMGLHILPEDNNTPAQQQCPLPISSNTLDSSQTRSKQQDPPTGSEGPVLQQQFEGELNEILDSFLQSFEQHVESCRVREDCEESNANSSDASRRCTVQTQTRSSSDPQEQEAGQVRSSQAAINGHHSRSPQAEPSEAPAVGDVLSIDSQKATKKTRKRKRAKTFMLSLEKKVQKKRKKDAEAKSVNEQADNRQKHSSKTLENKAQNSLPPEKCLCDHVSRGLKVYPIRSRKTRELSEELPLAEESPPAEQGHRSRRGRKRAQSPILSNEAEETVQVDSGNDSDDQAEDHQEEREEDFTLLLRKDLEDPTLGGRKREAACEETSHTSTIRKRPCIDQTPPLARETLSPSFGPEDLSSTEQDEVIDVETVSLRSESDYLQDTKLKEEEKLGQVIRMEIKSSDDDDDEIIDLEGDQEEQGSLI